MQEIGEHLFLIVMFTYMYGIIMIPIPWFMLSVLTPKPLLETFFKEPHFTLTETYMMSQFPGFLLRTSIFAWSIFFPKLAKKRQIQKVIYFMPSWYRFALIFLNINVLVILTITISSIVFFIAIDYFQLA